MLASVGSRFPRWGRRSGIEPALFELNDGLIYSEWDGNVPPLFFQHLEQLRQCGKVDAHRSERFRLGKHLLRRARQGDAMLASEDIDPVGYVRHEVYFMGRDHICDSVL